MTAEEVLKLFDKCARRWLGLFPPNSCIEQTRVLIEVLARFGIAAEPVGAKLHVVVPGCGYQFFSSGDPADYERAQNNPAGFAARPSDRPHDQHTNHVVCLVERRILVDLTLDQASAPERGCTIKPFMCAVPLGVTLAPDELPDLTAESDGEGNSPFTVRWLCSPKRDWEDTPAWEPSHLWGLIDYIEARMRKLSGGPAREPDAQSAR